MCAQFQDKTRPPLRVYNPDNQPVPQKSPSLPKVKESHKPPGSSATLVTTNGLSELTARENTNLKALANDLNAAWRKLGHRYDLLSRDTLSKCLPSSPEKLQHAVGPQLVMRVALSADCTQARNYSKQVTELRIRSMDVADPASTALVLAAKLIDSHASRDVKFCEHFSEVEFRTQPVDPATGRKLRDRSMTVRFRPGLGILAEEETKDDRKSVDAAVWCAGTNLTPAPRNWFERFRDWVQGHS